jgi:hypothetical protein
LTTRITGRSNGRATAAFWDRAARGSVYPRKMACRSAVGVSLKAVQGHRLAQGAACRLPLCCLAVLIWRFGLKPCAGRLQRDTVHPAQRLRRPTMTSRLRASNGLLVPSRTDGQCARCARRLAHDRGRIREITDRLHPSARRRIPTADTSRTNSEYVRFGYARGCSSNRPRCRILPSVGFAPSRLLVILTQRMTISACHSVKEVTRFGASEKSQTAGKTATAA